MKAIVVESMDGIRARLVSEHRTIAEAMDAAEIGIDYQNLRVVIVPDDPIVVPRDNYGYVQTGARRLMLHHLFPGLCDAIDTVVAHRIDTICRSEEEVEEAEKLLGAYLG